MKLICLCGFSGSGKSTLAELLNKKYNNSKIISTGRLLVSRLRKKLNINLIETVNSYGFRINKNL